MSEVLIAEGDWGGQIYFAIDTDLVTSTFEEIGALLRDIDSIEWSCNNGDGAAVYTMSKERLASYDNHILGGMGGLAYVTGELTTNCLMDRDMIKTRLGVQKSVPHQRMD